jgi:hypothetical protein
LCGAQLTDRIDARTCDLIAAPRDRNKPAPRVLSGLTRNIGGHATWCVLLKLVSGVALDKGTADRNGRRELMILRLWRGWTSAEATSTAYQELLTKQIAPAILARGIPGLRDLTVWRRDTSELGGPGAEILTAMTFDDRDAIATFTGGDPTRSVVPDEARRLLARFDEHSQHYTDVARFAS